MNLLLIYLLKGGLILKKIKRILPSLFLFSLIISCQPNVEVQRNESKDITIKEVHQKFDNINNTNANARSATDGTQIIWGLGTYQKISIGDALSFPIINNPNQYVSGSEDGKRLNSDYSSFAFAYKRNGKVHLELAQPVPTSNDTLFTGYVKISEWNGQGKRILLYKKGKYLKTLRAVSGDSNSENSHRILMTCETTYYWDCVDVSVDGNVLASQCDQTGSVTTCYSDTNDDSTPSPIDEVIDAGGSSGGGGDGGESPSDENLCHSPFNYSLMVPCNDITCGQNMVSDGNGGCIPKDELGIDCASFAFTPTTSNWQEAAVKDIGYNIKVINASTGDSYYRSMKISRAIWFGLPKTRYNGQTITPGMAAEIAASAVQYASDLTHTLYVENPETPISIAESTFMDYLKSKMAVNGGRADFMGSGSSKVPIKTASYDLFGNGDCD